MRHFKKYSLLIISLMTMFGFVGCADNVDMYLGSDYLPGDHIIGLGEIELKGVDREGRSITSTRLFDTERINAANQKYAVMGLEHDKRFGTRRSGFYTQYTPTIGLKKDDLFGTQPFMDSMIIFLTMNSFSGDTTYVCTYEVYEVVDDSFLTNKSDSVFTKDFDLFAAGALNPEPLFEFVYPDQKNGIYTTSPYVMSVNISKSGYALGDKLMLKDGYANYSVYDGDYEQFVDKFKGLYIVPKESSVPVGEGASYAISTSASGFGFYGRSLYEDDPTIVADTISMVYSFYDQNVVDDVSGVSIQNTVHDYSESDIDYSKVKNKNNLDAPSTSRMFVEGMGGVVSEITFERALFNELELILAEADEEYTNLLFNSTHMKIYTEMASGNDPLLSPDLFTPDQIEQFNLYPTRLGLYDTYSTFLDSDRFSELEAVADYDYFSEITNGITSNYSGMLNRTQGCYEMSIPLQMQSMWNDYLIAKEQAGGNADDIDWAGAEWNKLYVAPLVEDLFSPKYVTLQGGAQSDEGEAAVAPIRIDMTYTLLKR